MECKDVIESYSRLMNATVSTVAVLSCSEESGVGSWERSSGTDSRDHEKDTFSKQSKRGTESRLCISNAAIISLSIKKHLVSSERVVQ